MPKTEIITGVKRGFAVGDFVFTGAFPAIIISDVRTFAPCCEVFGFEQESGSVYATDLVKITPEKFLELAARSGHTPPFTVYGKASFTSLVGAGIKAIKA